MTNADATAYQVLVDYRDPRAGCWYGPQEDADTARTRYATEAARISAGGIQGVYLCKHGVVVALAKA